MSKTEEQKGWHISPKTNKPAKCSAKRCPFGQKHYATEAEAGEAAAFQQELYDNAMAQRQKKKRLFASFSPEEKDLALRDERQKHTIYKQILEDGTVAEEDLDAQLAVETRSREASLGVLSLPGGENSSPIVGISYNGDYRYEEEAGMRAISEALDKGTFDPDTITYEELKDGKAVLTIPNPENQGRYMADEGISRSKAAGIARASNTSRYDLPFSVLQEVRRKTIPELRAELKGIVKPLPTKREALENAYLNYKHPLKIKPTIGEFHSGAALVIVSDSPVMKKVMASTVQSAHKKTLRVGSSANPFSRGVMFYDTRDISREHKTYEKEYNKVQTASFAKVDKAVKSFNAKVKSGDFKEIRVFSSSARPGETSETKEDNYYLYIALPKDKTILGKDNIVGNYNAKEINQIAAGDYSPVEKVIADRAARGIAY